ncbi:MAG: hypothetical protein ACE5JX_06135 [Acidobacteriota bacterium]
MTKEGPAAATHSQDSVVSCYEAGRDAFWVHRWLLSQGVEKVVIDSSSIEVNRRSRRASGGRPGGPTQKR